jgi:hypothetical protein
MMKNPRFKRAIALFLLVQFCFQIFFPTVSYALTSGPSQPEFSSFEPVGTTQMVNEFTGDFTYNLPILEIPGPHGSSYPLSLSYHSGVTPEEEASWVGYGWTLNPGAINRNTRGLPDDYKGPNIKMNNKRPKSWTGTVGGSVGFGEVFGVDLKKLAGAELSANLSVRYNNYRGFGYNAGIGVSIGRGLVSMGYNVSDGEGSYSLNVNPYAALNWTSYAGRHNVEVNEKRYLAISKKIAEKQKDKQQNWNRNASIGSATNLAGSSYGVFSYSESSKPNIVHPYGGKSFNFTVGLEGNLAIVPAGGTAAVAGSYTYQQNNDVETVKGYGYMYSSLATDNDMMDYHVENEKDFNKRDVFLGVPFNDADNFIVTGEGIGGGFRMYNKRAGHFSPRASTSTLDIFNIGGEVGAGWTFGPGADVGKGSYNLKVQKWNKLSTFSDATDPLTDEGVFFRFNNDLGGEWGNSHDDAPFSVALSNHNISLATGKDKLNVTDDRSGRSSYIGYHLNKDMAQGAVPSFAAYSKNKKINDLCLRTSLDRADLIGEFAVFNEAGSRYVYGLPVYGKMEKMLNHSAKGITSLMNNHLAYVASPNAETKIGEERDNLYATSYLLTEITTPDYVDAGELSGTQGEFGPSDDDLGGYTRFNYEKKTPSYIWRAPFKGLIYNKNSHSDPLDDMLSYSQGDKEVYYLHSIETKTHVAMFTLAGRNDGRGSSVSAFNGSASVGAQVFRLIKIDLYSIADCKRVGNILDRETWGSPKLRTDITPSPVKTVNFVYDYGLMNGVPNSLPASGKLRLKNVYFEYNKIQPLKVSPYEFVYEYPKATIAEAAGKTSYEDYPTKYRTGLAEENVTSGFTSLSSGDQNPIYSEFLTDAWGYYQKDGHTRFDNMQPWVNQKNVTGFDAAAWHLKVIRLPSGGEIHVQYEQDDYSYVQDQEAHQMAPLKEVLSPIGDLFKIDGAALGFTATDAEQAGRMIDKRYVQGGKKMYFRFLYTLIGSNVPDLQTCNAEFITGYVTVKRCDVVGVDLVLTLESDPKKLPRQVCDDFVKSQRLGKVDPTANCDPSIGVSDPNDPKALVMQLLNLARGITIPTTLCSTINPVHSYFRIPAPLSKKGGGVRVKRLMIFDKGLEAKPVLYGNEYLYQVKEDGRIISSGVATNEPIAAREENILVDFVARKNQNLWSKIIAGKDKEVAEGPIGETVLPGPSVGYSRVTVRSIHSGKSNPGFTIFQFYTAKDFPIKMAHPDLAGSMTTIKRNDTNPIPIVVPFHTKVKTKTSAAQGFTFVVNNMHGQLRSKTSYSGPSSDVFDLTRTKVTGSTVYEYFKPGEQIPMMNSVFGGIRMGNPGREVDITYAQRSVKEVSNDVNVEADLQLTIIPLAFIVLVIPYPTAIPSFSYIEGELNTHATTKVVRYPAIVKKVETYQDGITHTEENLAFDEYTGRPVSIRRNDDFKGAYLSQNIPASWEYTAMGTMSPREGKVIRGSFTFANGLLKLGSDPCLLAEFTPGDLIKLGTSSSTAYHVIALDLVANGLIVEKLNAATVASASFSEISILHTGRTNQLNHYAGNITIHNEQKQLATPMVISQTNRYETTTNTFIQAFNAATTGLSGSGNFTLPGIYTQMDMSGFADRLTTCNIDLTNAAVKQLDYRYSVTGGQVTLELMSFDIKCVESPEQWITIAAGGWD